MLKFFRQYVGALLGTIFGAVVATLTTMLIYGDLPVQDAEVLQQCIMELSTAKRQHLLLVLASLLDVVLCLMCCGLINA